MANKTYTEVLDTMVSWTEEYRDGFQQKVRFGEHRAVCGLAGKYYGMPDPITYPNISIEFAPVDECASRQAPSSGHRQAVAQYSLNVFALAVAASYIVMLCGN